jgi:hypothetical protein
MGTGVVRVLQELFDDADAGGVGADQLPEPGGETFGLANGEAATTRR